MRFALGGLSAMVLALFVFSVPAGAQADAPGLPALPGAEPSPSPEGADLGLNSEPPARLRDPLGSTDEGALPGGEGPERTDDIGEGWRAVAQEHPVATGAIVLGVVGTAATAWFLASRYVDPAVALQSPARSMLYGYVKVNPGVHLKALSTQFEMKTSTVLWHVRKLEHADLVRSRKANGFRVFYPVSGGVEAKHLSEAVTALSNSNARRVFGYFAEHPTVPGKPAAGPLGMPPATLRWHLGKLRTSGLVEAADGEGDAYIATELGLRAWEQVGGAGNASEQPTTSGKTPVPA